MTPERWAQIEAVYAQADSAPAEDRLELLERLCAGDEDLRAQVDKLLVVEQSPDFIHEAIGEAKSFLVDDESETRDRFGPYRPVRQIGEGGMGAVYEAVRVDDFHKKVAIKVVRHGFDSEFARTRFQQERQLLAALEHPYIARLLDGGETDDASPYLVLEFVEGAPFDEACGKLDLRARLVLFLRVCEAVAYAHRNLVVHRDLKPANILVTENGDPKLLDFGLAKLAGPGIAETRSGFVGMTPEYASPEQVSGKAVSTASDIYSLGVVFYQLLTGKRPYEVQGASPAELVRIVCEQLPSPAQIPEELDAIARMALRKEPERRYATVEQFAEDIQCYLDHRPVRARPDTFGYRGGKFIRRNKLSLSAAAVTFLALAGGLGAALYQARIANERFNDVRFLATRFLFDFDKEISGVPGNTKARQLVVNTARDSLDKLAATAANDQGLLSELATAYEKLGDVEDSPGVSNLGQPQQAAESYRKAIAILERLASRNPKYRKELANALSFSGRILAELLRIDESVAATARAAALTDQLRAESPSDPDRIRDSAAAYTRLAVVDLGIYRNEDAMIPAEKAVAMLGQVLPQKAPARAAHPLALAVVRQGLGHRGLADLETAATQFLRATQMEEQMLLANPADAAVRMALGNIHEDLAELYQSDRYPSEGRPDDSLAEWQKADRIYSAAADADANDMRAQIYSAIAKSGTALVTLGEQGARKADQPSEQGLKLLDRVLERAPDGGFARSHAPHIRYVRASVLAQLGRKLEAVSLSRQAVDEQRALVRTSASTPDVRLDLSGQLLFHAQVLVLCGDIEGARAASQEALALIAGLDRETHRWVSYAYQAAQYRMGLAKALDKAGLRQDAAASFAEAARLWSLGAKDRPYVEKRIAEASSAHDRCLR